MDQLMNEARIVITHGGPASFMDVIAKGKQPIVVPRQEKFNEHVNNHQVDFTQQVQAKGYPMERILDVQEIEDVLKKYNDAELVDVKSHNSEFVGNLTEIINGLI
ncbi:hypothetical protein IV68_GL001153 [Weissella halotolerans DSM 20190]|uniref:Glycosyl transferase family 28 C-terminal domain-containing protein n=2 Tax=Weissella halotolerans TaxID=1615 RepID=A0A0R2FUY4_9LACO|nr:hypothetical protein IV68_GL001153 [Weissella halotolerans DSM 20190]